MEISLPREDVYLYDTARKNRRGFPKDLLEDKHMKRGDIDWRMNNFGIVAVKWKDNKPVHFLSNCHNPEDKEQISRKQKDGSRK